MHSKDVLLGALLEYYNSQRNLKISIFELFYECTYLSYLKNESLFLCDLDQVKCYKCTVMRPFHNTLGVNSITTTVNVFMTSFCEGFLENGHDKGLFGAGESSFF